MTDERQKKTTEEYRSNWDAIFKKPNQQPKQEQQNENTPRTNP